MDHLKIVVDDEELLSKSLNESLLRDEATSKSVDLARSTSDQKINKSFLYFLRNLRVNKFFFFLS